MKTIMVSERLWRIAGLLFTLHSFDGLANDIHPHSVLKKHYLSKFIDKTLTDKDDETIVHTEAGGLRRYSLNDRMTPLRTRSLLLNYLCPECTGKTNPQNYFPVNIHSDIWLDSQVFQIEGKAHLYDAAFPGMSLMGEVYGAYLLVTGATQDLNLLKLRQNMIREIQNTGLTDQLREPINELNQLLPLGLSVFDRKHPFNTIAKGELFMDENLVDALLSILPLDAPSSQKGLIQILSSTSSDQYLMQNLDGTYAKFMSRTPYIVVAMGAAASLASYELITKTRNLKLLPWQGKKNYLVNSLKLPLRLGGQSPLLFTAIGLSAQIHEMYQQHWAYKNATDVLSEELLAIKPFIERLFSFNTFRGLPLVDFTLAAEESILIDSLLAKMNQLNSDTGHFYHKQLVEVASSLRMLLLLRETIVRYLANIATLDFYLAVAETAKNPDLWCFAKYDQKSQKPKLNAHQLWNPIIPAEKAVPGNVTLGGKHPASIILTGANASGKSTFLRALGINSIFMAQTLGVAASEKFTLSPFTHFVSLMEKRDSQGRSSYETEVDAVVQAWAVNSNLRKKHRSLILADELFRTTNPREGASASRLLARKLGSLPQVSLLISTHFKELTELAAEHPSLFANKHMSVETDENRQVIRMNYRLSDGPSPSANAIQLFEKNLRQAYPEMFQ